MLPSEEVEQLRQGLMHKWNMVNQKYQLMTHLQKVDTIGQLRKYPILTHPSRKVQLEQELTQIEKDLQKLSKSYVFVEK